MSYIKLLSKFVKPKPFFKMNKIERFCYSFDYQLFYKIPENIYFFFYDNFTKEGKELTRKRKEYENERKQTNGI